MPISTPSYAKYGNLNSAADGRPLTAYYLDFSSNANNNNINFFSSVWTLIVIIFIISTSVTVIPLVAKRVRRLKMPVYVFLFVRYFPKLQVSASTTLATALLHLLDPPSSDMGAHVGFTHDRVPRFWHTASVLTCITIFYTLSFSVQLILSANHDKPQQPQIHNNTGTRIVAPHNHKSDNVVRIPFHHSLSYSHLNLHFPPHGPDQALTAAKAVQEYEQRISAYATYDAADEHRAACVLSASQQLTTFLTLESHTLLHSLITGFALATIDPASSNFFCILLARPLFDGLGLGARLCAVPFRRRSWLPWVLCAGYGLLAPVAMGAGLLLRDVYVRGSVAEGVVAAVLDSMATGGLILAGLQELLVVENMLRPPKARGGVCAVVMLLCGLVRTGWVVVPGRGA
ncbi:high-affinity Zn(2+) transporter zrt1 [Xylographa opegraphella]|nr:high-affinity Zn(2+) transporter zrt1 [Xylographa opegraphella]